MRKHPGATQSHHLIQWALAPAPAGVIGACWLTTDHPSAQLLLIQAAELNEHRYHENLCPALQHEPLTVDKGTRGAALHVQARPAQSLSAWSTGRLPPVVHTVQRAEAGQCPSPELISTQARILPALLFPGGQRSPSALEI